MIGNFSENLRVAVRGLGANKLRTALTTLGITIGVAAVIVLVSLGQAFEGFVRSQFLGLGTNLLLVFPGENQRGETVRPTVSEAELLADPLLAPDILRVMPQVNFTRPVLANGREGQGRIRGVSADFLAIRSEEVVAGRFFDGLEVDGLARVAVIGQVVVERLFPDTYPIGATMRLGEINFRVIGVMQEAGSANPFAGDDNDLIFVPYTTALTRLSGERDLSGNRPLTNILIQARDAGSIDAAAQQARAILREERGIAFRDEDTFELFTQDDLLESLNQITGLLTIFLAIIAGISLLVGGIGIMNIMLVTVTERTREIGLRKAVGAQRRDISLQFLIEAMVLALLGGGLGVAIAILGSVTVSALVPDLQVSVQPASVVLATAISIAIGVFFGLYPASRAAALNPIDALRYE